MNDTGPYLHVAHLKAKVNYFDAKLVLEPWDKSLERYLASLRGDLHLAENQLRRLTGGSYTDTCRLADQLAEVQFRRQIIYNNRVVRGLKPICREITRLDAQAVKLGEALCEMS